MVYICISNTLGGDVWTLVKYVRDSNSPSPQFPRILVRAPARLYAVYADDNYGTVYDDTVYDDTVHGDTSGRRSLSRW